MTTPVRFSSGFQRRFMPTMCGKCGLCLEQAELQYSHLLPAALYRLIGSGTNPVHPDTVQLTSDGPPRKSSEQARRHILCSRCEQHFNNKGERWMLRNCYRGKGRFRLRSELRKRDILDSGFEYEAYSALVEEVASLSYFCLSVVWRASLCDWFCRGRTYEQISLGPYQEEIRKYLRGETDPPRGVEVMVVLSWLDRPHLAMSFPASYREDFSHGYRFHIPGVTFAVTVGGNRSLLVDETCILRAPNPILIGTIGDKLAQDGMMQAIGKAPPRGFEAPLLEGTEKI